MTVAKFRAVFHSNCQMKRVIDGDCIRVFIVDKEDMSAGTEFRYDHAPFNGKKELYWRVTVFIDVFEEYISSLFYINLNQCAMPFLTYIICPNFPFIRDLSDQMVEVV